MSEVLSEREGGDDDDGGDAGDDGSARTPARSSSHRLPSSDHAGPWQAQSVRMYATSERI